MKGEEVPSFEYELITREGNIIEAILTTKLISYEGETAILGTVTDITERKQAEEILKKSQDRYRHTSALLDNVISNMSEYVHVMDEDYDILFQNKTAKKYYGDKIGEKCYKAIRNLD